jgi:hypothetical protein
MSLCYAEPGTARKLQSQYFSHVGPDIQVSGFFFCLHRNLVKNAKNISVYN